MPKISRATGTSVKIFGLFSDPETKDPLDPVTVEVVIKAPDQTVSTYEYGVDAELIRGNVGIYFITLLLAQEGTYHWKWQAAGVPGVSVVVPGDIDSVQSVDF